MGHPAPAAPEHQAQANTPSRLRRAYAGRVAAPAPRVKAGDTDPGPSTIRSAVRGTLSGRLPQRYPSRSAPFWRVDFDAQVQEALLPGMTVLDVGSGREPAVPRERRPADCHYVGLDISRSEMEKAPTGSYDEAFVEDVTARVRGLEGRFDLIVSLFVFEHVKPLDAALDNLHGYLSEGGRLIAQMSGAFSPFALVSRAIPHRAVAWLVRRLGVRDADTVFPAHYHRCWHGALTRMLSTWSEAKVVPLHTGAHYLQAAPPLQAAYIGYEEWAYRGEHQNLAAWYLVSARR